MSAHAPSTSPRYVEIADDLRNQIVSQHLSPNTLLPSERELSEQHSVSRMTARKAVTLLETEGYVSRRPPRGTFVAEPRVRFRIGSFSQEASRLGRRATAQLLWAKKLKADAPMRAALDLRASAQVHGFHRLRLIEGEPIALESTYFSAALTPGILQLPGDGSLWALMKEHYGIHITRADAVIESMILDERACELLHVRTASPGILLTRRSFDGRGRCIEYARDAYRADRAAFEVSATVDV